MADEELRMIIPTHVNASNWLFSSVPEADYPQWIGSGHAYAVGDRVIINNIADPIDGGTYHWICECIVAHSSSFGVNDPGTDIDRTTGAGTKWLRVSFTNMWKAFDGQIGNPSVYAGDIQSWFLLNAVATSVVFFGAVANTCEVKVWDGLTDVFVATKSPIDRGNVLNWWDYFYQPIVYDPVVIFPGVPGYVGKALRTKVSGLPTNQLGEVAFGPDHYLGYSLFPINPGMEDFSTKDRDTFGNPFIVVRAFADTQEFKSVIHPTDVVRVRRLINSVRATPCIFYTHEDNRYASAIYGIVSDMDIQEIAPDCAYLTLQIEGLI